MKLENQVTNLEISKRLKELEVKQESIFFWERDREMKFSVVSKEDLELDQKRNNFQLPGDLYCSAFTCAELGEMLPNEYTYCRKTGGEWYISFDSVHYGNQEHDVSEANARGKMLIYLIENGLYPLPSKT